MKHAFLFISLIIGLCSYAQNQIQNDSTIIVTKDIDTDYHSPRKATILSAVLPGAGQFYNKKYWKIPIVYAGLGTCVGFIVWNNREFQVLKRNYIAAVDDDPLTIVDDEFIDANGNPATDFLFEWQDRHRKWRDISYMSMVGVYILNMIDANVDAHLFHYDVSEDLSLRWQPSFYQHGQPSAGISLTLNWK